MRGTVASLCSVSPRDDDPAILLASNNAGTGRGCPGLAAEVADQPVARAGLGRDLDRDGEQALAAGHEQRAQPSIRVASDAGMGRTPPASPPRLARARAAETSQPCTAISTAPVQATRPAGIGRPPTATKHSGPP